MVIFLRPQKLYRFLQESTLVANIGKFAGEKTTADGTNGSFERGRIVLLPTHRARRRPIRKSFIYDDAVEQLPDQRLQNVFVLQEIEGLGDQMAVRVADADSKRGGPVQEWSDLLRLLKEWITFVNLSPVERNCGVQLGGDSHAVFDDRGRLQRA